MKNKNVKIRIINNTLKDHNGDIIAVNRKPWERYNRKNIILEAKKGSTILEVIKAYNIKMHYPIIASKIDNIIKELNTPINKDCRIELLDLQDRDGVRIYRRGVEFIMVMAVRELIVDADPVLLHSLSRGVYCELQGLKKIDRSVVNRIEARMKQIVKADLPFIKKQYSKELASEFFELDGQLDKVKLFKYRKKKTIFLYTCGSTTDYFYGYMPSSTGMLNIFKLRYYPPGMILTYPERQTPQEISVFIDNKQLADVLIESKKWAKIMEVPNVGSLNDIITLGGSTDLIQVAEALHEKKTAQIADMIYQRKNRVKLVLIAGPSSSGKTTFSKRLITQLRVLGLKPLSISTDDFFLDREKTPKDENGQYDFESINAIDIELFNSVLIELIEGKKIRMPVFNFSKGKREICKDNVCLLPDQLIIVEGIHALNERLTSHILKENKFKIYISALTQVNLDNHNRIHTTDVRLIRRTVRDYNFRSHSAEDTLAMWDSVRSGEEKYIFPFQEEADVMFNSALVYELSVLKKFAVPLFKKIKRSSKNYSEAKRILSFLNYFREVNSKDVPNNSILREFIGKEKIKY